VDKGIEKIRRCQLAERNDSFVWWIMGKRSFLATLGMTVLSGENGEESDSPAARRSLSPGIKELTVIPNEAQRNEES